MKIVICICLGLAIIAIGFLMRWIIIKKPPVYNYHVSYFFTNEEGNGQGSMHIDINSKITTSQQVVDIKKFISKANNFEACVIINWIFLNKTRKDKTDSSGDQL